MASKARTIFLADDDPEDQEILKDAILKQEPAVNIHSVVNGQQAIDYLINCPDDDLPSLLILDYKMPMFNAVEILERIADVPQLQAIPKVVWSTSNQADHAKRCIEMGAALYFVKPTKAEELNNIARQMLNLGTD